MTDYILSPELLCKNGFPDFVEAIDTDKHADILEINYGMPKRYNNPAKPALAQDNGQPTPHHLRLFITNSSQSINFNKDTWHNYLLALNHSANFIVVDRYGKENNRDKIFFNDDIVIEKF